MKKPKLIVVSRLPAPYREPLFEFIHNSGQTELKVIYEMSGREGTAWGLGGTGFENQLTYEKEFLYPEEIKGLRSLIQSFRTFVKVYQKLNIEAPDLTVIHGYSFPAVWAAIFYCWKWGKKYALRSDSNQNLNTKKGIKRNIKDIFLRKLVKKADSILYIGTTNCEFWKFYGASEKQLIEAKYAVDEKRFSPINKEQKSKFRQELNLPLDSLIFLFTGRLITRKNPVTLAKSFLNVGKSLNNVKLIIAGGGELESDLKKVIQNSNSTNIIYLGKIPPSEINKLYGASDVFICPYEYEPWGLTINEAMSCGLPVVAPINGTCGAAVDLVHNLTNGIGLSEVTEKSIINSINFILENSHLLPEWQENSLHIIQDWKYKSSVNGFILAAKKSLEI